jgi:cytochrome c-type biogenesis protein CcmF
MMRNDAGYWGGQISHFGVALLALGIAISANLSVTAEVVLEPGETATVAGYDIVFEDVFSREEENRSVVGANVRIERDGEVLGREQPAINRYAQSGQSVATPAVDESLAGDLYLSLQSWGPQGAQLGIWWFPYIWLVWVGGFITGLAVLWSRLARKPARDRQPVMQTTADER